MPKHSTNGNKAMRHAHAELDARFPGSIPLSDTAAIYAALNLAPLVRFGMALMASPSTATDERVSLVAVGELAD